MAETANSVLIYINDIPMPEPSQYSFPMQDALGESVYNENGELFRDRIRQGIATIELAWVVDGGQAKTLLDAIKPDKVSVKFFDPRENDFQTKEMYVGDRSCELVKFQHPEPGADDLPESLWSVGFSLSEY